MSDMTVPSDPSPPKSSTVIWRYMDDWKFESFLGKFSEHEHWVEASPGKTIQFNEPGRLWFSYPWTFGDRLEASLPKANKAPEEYCDRMAALLKLSTDEAARRKQDFLAANTATLQECVLSMAQICGVTCWHENTVESEGMWEEFVQNQNGVAIKTTVGQLEYALGYAHNSPRSKAQPSLCAVGYVDHRKYYLPADGFRNLLGIIRSDYSYEKEVRFVAKSPDLARVPTKITRPMPDDPAKWEQAFKPLTKEEKEKYIIDWGKQCAASFERIRRDNEKGFNLPIKLDGLINEVVLKSGCTRDYRATVDGLLQAAALNGTAIRDSTI